MDERTEIRTEDMLQIIGELFLQTRVLQRMLQTVTHPEQIEKEKLNNVSGSNNSVAAAASNLHSGSQGSS